MSAHDSDAIFCCFVVRVADIDENIDEDVILIRLDFIYSVYVQLTIKNRTVNRSWLSISAHLKQPSLLSS